MASLIREHEVELLERDEKLRRSGIGLDLREATIEPDGLGMTDDDLEFYQFVIGLLDQGVRKQAAKMRPSEMVALAVNRAVERRRRRCRAELPPSAGSGSRSNGA